MSINCKTIIICPKSVIIAHWSRRCEEFVGTPARIMDGKIIKEGNADKVGKKRLLNENDHDDTNDGQMCKKRLIDTIPVK